MKKRLPLVVFAFLLFETISFSSFGQRLVTGRVVDKESGKALKEATIKLMGTSIETNVNVLGFFQLQIDSIDQILINSAGYDIATVKIPNADNFKIEMIRVPLFTEEEKKYLDDLGFPCDRSTAKSYQVIKPHPKEPAKFLVHEYDLANKIKQIGTYSDNGIYVRDGHFTLYYANGQPIEEGFYIDNSKIGKWIEWYPNGKIKEESFREKSFNGFSEFKILNFFDSLGNALAINGEGQYIIEEDAPLVYGKGSIKNGLKTGKWTGYFKNGEIAYEEEYKEGNLIKGLSYDSLRNEYIYDKISESNIIEVYEFISKNIKYPADAKRSNIQGKVIIHLVIGSEGKILKSRIAKGVGGGCDEEALRVVLKYNGNWNDSKRRGQSVKTITPKSLYFPINFKLG
ncbi:MAG TPA: energy transducer TonB [Chryseolinea sp.]|nr:energy transducer TonB [Chryseolinea sp.]